MFLSLLVSCSALVSEPVEPADAVEPIAAVDPGAHCSALDRAGCEADAACSPVLGKPICGTPQPNGGTVVGPTGDPPQYGMCLGAETACISMMVNARSPDGGACLEFSGCVPPGWQPCDAPICPEKP